MWGVRCKESGNREIERRRRERGEQGESEVKKGEKADDQLYPHKFVVIF